MWQAWCDFLPGLKYIPYKLALKSKAVNRSALK
jgi:hypothetical protein